MAVWYEHKWCYDKEVWAIRVVGTEELIYDHMLGYYEFGDNYEACLEKVKELNKDNQKIKDYQDARELDFKLMSANNAYHREVARMTGRKHY
jgi:hypothetical protein